MISQAHVTEIVQAWLAQTDYFLTDLQISPDNRIVVEIDHADGVWIDDCVALSRHIEDHLDRETEDFELEVGSAGIGQPFKVHRQYEVHEGDDVEVLTADGHKLKGTLTDVGEEAFTVLHEEKVRLEGEKRPKLREVPTRLRFDEVKWTKLLIQF